jgi:RNA polymerase sigma factor (sigma-70 family)
MRDEEFERLYEEHAQGLLGFLIYRTGDRVLAEDLFEETFERVLRSRWRFDRRKGTEKGWIYSIALNCLRDHARREGAERRALERAGAGPANPPWLEPYESVDERDAIDRALNVLSAEEREAIALRYGAGLRLKEIASVTKERNSTVQGRVYRALEKLRGELS